MSRAELDIRAKDTSFVDRPHCITHAAQYGLWCGAVDRRSKVAGSRPITGFVFIW